MDRTQNINNNRGCNSPQFKNNTNEKRNRKTKARKQRVKE